MPKVWQEKGYKFYIYLNESKYEPAHVHIWRTEGGEMKVWLADLEIEEVYNIPPHEWSVILKIINKQKKLFEEKWNEFKKRRES